jgi:hypothetical protein
MPDALSCQHSFRHYLPGALETDRRYSLGHPAGSLLKVLLVFLFFILPSERDPSGRLLHQSGKNVKSVLVVTVSALTTAKFNNYCAF